MEFLLRDSVQTAIPAPKTMAELDENELVLDMGSQEVLFSEQEPSSQEPSFSILASESQDVEPPAEEVDAQPDLPTVVSIQEVVSKDQRKAPATKPVTHTDSVPSSEELPPLPPNLLHIDRALLFDLQRVPDRLGFRTGEVLEILDIKSHVLRQWEADFEGLRPQKTSLNQRLFDKRNIEFGLLIKKLLHRDGCSVLEAQHAIKRLKSDLREYHRWNTALGQHSDALEALHDLIEHIQDVKQSLC